MRLELAKSLFDVQQPARTLAGFVAGRGCADYERDTMLRAAVERRFESVGEALTQPELRDPGLAGRIGEYRRLIAFRNILIHRYANVHNGLVWDIVQTHLQPLRAEVDAPLDSAAPDA